MTETSPSDGIEIDYGFPPNFFELIGRITYSAAKLEYLLTDLAVYLSVLSAPSSDRTAALASTRIRLAGRPGTELTRLISEAGSIRLAPSEAEAFQDYLNSARRALEARHEIVHSRWFLFDFADPQHPAIAGVRYLPVHKRAEPDEPSVAYERTVKQFRNYLNDLNDQIENWRYWIEKLNIIGDYGWAQKGFHREMR